VGPTISGFAFASTSSLNEEEEFETDPGLMLLFCELFAMDSTSEMDFYFSIFF
jgi:hypothetical protein